VLKRIFDVAVGGFLLFMLLPIFAVIAALVAKDGGSAFFGHTRIGQNGKKFSCYKFRSMVPNADKVLKELLERDPVARAEWENDFKLKDDIRITPIGALLRKTSLDELPQLWNVIRGDMSIVGPRPERPQFVSDLETKIRFYNLRHSIKPGLAGWAQLSYPYGASEEDAAEKLKYDLFYVKNHNLFLDVVILIETVEVVLFGRGAR